MQNVDPNRQIREYQQNFEDPLTLEQMQDPILHRYCGRSSERASVLQTNRCLHCNAEVSIEDFVTDISLRNASQEFPERVVPILNQAREEANIAREEANIAREEANIAREEANIAVEISQQEKENQIYVALMAGGLGVVSATIKTAKAASPAGPKAAAGAGFVAFALGSVCCCWKNCRRSNRIIHEHRD